MAKLAAHECNGQCAWGPTGRELEGEPLFECSSCRSEWVPSQTWTPRNADGEISPEVAAVLRPQPDVDDEWG